MNTRAPVSLYIHVPFCAKKCLFCSFAVAIAQSHRVEDYLCALEREAKTYQGRALNTVYLGGGTPSFLSALQLERLTKIVRDHFQVSPTAEWTIETNPDGIDAQKCRTLKILGFTRVSLGVQSFNDAYLKFLGRTHDRLKSREAFSILRQEGFDNINVDLMYGFPKQSREELTADLEEAVALKSEHVSIYTLTIEPNSRFYAKQMKLDSDEKLAEDYVAVSEALEKAGLKQYEVSNFARPGFESRHNQMYWQGGDYIGLGMGAHSLMANRRFWNVSTLNDYIEKVKSQGHALEAEEQLPPITRLLERLIFGLRMNQGVDPYILEKELSLPLPADRRKLIDDFVQEGLLEQESGFLKATPRGRLVLDEIASRLI